MWWRKDKRTPPELGDRIATIETRMKEIELQWELAYDNLRSLVARYSKRAERIAASERAAAGESATLTGLSTATSPRILDPISQRILDRRRKLFPSQRQAGNSTEEEKSA